ncbi:MAG: AMP-binding protein [Bacteroidales bacterium]|nr:AMP-binding protein [Bacteroidales bacterium]MBN2764711.1 AMP-binding protein [Bacteroidales bacterium]
MRSIIRGAGLYDTFLLPDELALFSRQQLDKGNLPLWEKKIFSFILDFLDPSDHIIQESSGTTGMPKKLKIRKEAMIFSARLTAKEIGLQQGRLALLCLPVNYIAGKMMIVRALTTGMMLKWIEPSALPAITSDEKVDFCAMVPLQVYNLLEKGYPVSHIKNLIIGGSSISSTLENLLKDMPSRIYETFGMAETCSHIALRRISGSDAKPWFTALPGVKITTDSHSCLVIEAPFLPEPVVTRDVVEIRNKTDFIWKGRVDYIINSGGVKINPEITEKIIGDVLDHEVYLVGVPDDKLGQKIVMAALFHYSSGEKEKVIQKLKEILPAHHAPSEIIDLSSFPRNSAMKVNRIELLQQVLEKTEK